MRSSRVVALAFTTIIALSAQLTIAQESAKPVSAYALPAATQLDYTTSATFTVTGKSNVTQAADIRTSYTVLDAAPSGKTIFASAMLASMDVNGKPTVNKTTTRFTFVLQPDGSISEKMAGFYRPVFAAWSPSIDFPQMPDAKGTSVTVQLPLIEQPVEVMAKAQKAGDDLNITIDYSPKDAGQGSMVKSYRANYVYSEKDQALRSSNVQMNAAGNDQEGNPIEFHIALASTLKQRQQLPPAQFDTLKKDVLSGVQLLEKLRASLADSDKGPSESLKLMDSYLSQYPNGQFTATYAEMKAQIAAVSQIQANAANIQEGKPAPAFEAKSIDGKTVKLADYKGKVLLIDFWATWCGPCLAEFPNVKNTYEANHNKGFEIVGISADEDEQQLKDFIKDRQVEWPQVFEPKQTAGTVQLLYGVSKYPTTVLIDREGVIRRVDARADDLADAVAGLVKEKK